MNLWQCFEAVVDQTTYHLDPFHFASLQVLFADTRGNMPSAAAKCQNYPLGQFLVWCVVYSPRSMCSEWPDFHYTQASKKLGDTAGKDRHSQYLQYRLRWISTTLKQST